MSLQITSGVGGPVPTQGVTPTSTAGGSPQSTTSVPQYQFDFTGISRASALGLAPPTSAGDLEVLFARISTALKEALGELAEMDDVAKAERFRGRLGEALVAFDQMLRYGQTVDNNRENIKRQDEIEAEQTVLRDEAKERQKSLEVRKTTIELDIGTNNATIKTLNDGITSRNDERNDLTDEQDRITRDKISLQNERFPLLNDPVKNKARIEEINGLIGDIDRRLGQISDRIDVLDNEMGDMRDDVRDLERTNNDLKEELSGVEDRIKDEKDKVEDASNRIVEADRSRKASQETIRLTLGTMENFISNTIEVMLVAAGNTRSDMGRASGEVTTEGDFFENLLQDMARALVSVGSSLLQSQRDVDVALHTEGAGLNQTQSTPDRFGQLSAPIARAIAFAGMIAGVLGAVSDLVNGLARGLGMQTAGTMASAGETRVRVGL